MDKYQAILLEDTCYQFFINGKAGEYKKLKNNEIVLTQDKDITIKDYVLYIFNKYVISVTAIKGSKEIKLINGKDLDSPIFKYKREYIYYMSINFDDQIDGIKFVFRDNFADDLIIPVKYVMADKDLYYAEQEQKRKDNLLANANIKVATGDDLVNVYFQPCNEDYAYSEVKLFIPKEEKTRGYSSEGAVIDVLSWSMIKKCKINPEDFYLSIGGLAKGRYSIVLTQYDKNNNIIIQTENIEFYIKGANIIYGNIRPVNRIG